MLHFKIECRFLYLAVHPAVPRDTVENLPPPPPPPNLTSINILLRRRQHRHWQSDRNRVLILSRLCHEDRKLLTRERPDLCGDIPDGEVVEGKVEVDALGLPDVEGYSAERSQRQLIAGRFNEWHKTDLSKPFKILGGCSTVSGNPRYS